ncbi:MAG: hypothetical protein HOI70_10200, partial [Opitutae bacterium]|nr:hypothetical protein [Opitutae bacterium]
GHPAPPTGAPHHPAGAPHFQGQPGPAAGYPAPPTGAPHHPAGAPHFQGQPGPAAGHPAPPTGAPHFPGQPAPGEHIPGQTPDHDEIVGTIEAIDTANQIVIIRTKNGPVELKVTEDSELLLPGESPEQLLEIDPEDFKRESKGKMVRIASRNGKIDHIKPAN